MPGEASAGAPLRVRLTGSVPRSLRLDVGVEVGPGERLALVGSNGAGKTSVLRLLAGLDRAAPGSSVTSGRTVLVGDRVHVRADERRLPMTFAEPRLFPTMTVLDNLVFGAARSGRSQAATTRLRALAALDALGLGHLVGRRAGELSSGQSAVLAVLRTVLAPAVGVLLDEPFSSLDTEVAADARSAVHGWLDQLPVPLVLATHSVLDVMALATHVAVLDDGVLVQHGTVDEVARRPTSRFAASFVGLDLFAGHSHGTEVLVDGTFPGPASARSDRAVAATRPPAGPWTVRLSSSTPADGPVWVAVAPRATTLHASRPADGPRNIWETTVAAVEQLGAAVRVTCAAPLPLRVDVAAATAIRLGARPGATVWGQIDPSSLEVYPA